MEKGAQQDEEIRAFDSRVRKILGDSDGVSYTLEPAITGTQVEMTYDHGTLKSAIASGGSEITLNLKTILSVPVTLDPMPEAPPIPELLQVTGTVYIEELALQDLNNTREQEGLSPFPGPQEAAKEALGQSDPRKAARCPLACFCQGALPPRGTGIETHYGLMTALQQWGFRVNRPQLRVCSSVSEVVDGCREIQADSSRFPFEVQGALITVNPLEWHARLGPNRSYLCRF